MKKKIVFSFILGILISSVAYAAISIKSSDISYDNKDSGSSATTVKEALDDLFEKASTLSGITLLEQTEFTQEEFIDLCNKGLQGLLQVGSIISLNNPYCEKFVVIGTNHEGILNSVDIMPITQVATMGDTTRVYKDSAIRKWINGTYIESFDLEVQNLMKYQDIIANGDSLSDKAKIMSIRDIGFYGTYANTDDSGIQYEYFPQAMRYSTGNGVWVPAGKYGSSSFYWIRTYNTGTTSGWWGVNNDNTVSGHWILTYPETGGILPILRF